MDGMSGRERARNWWHYHKLAVLLTAFCLIAAAALLRGLFAREKPDLSVGLVASETLPPEAASALEGALSQLCGDVNGDGQVRVELEQFALDFDAAQDYSNMDEHMANVTLLTGSIYAADGAGIFLLEDPEGFQRRTGALQYLNGSIPTEENAYDAANWQEMTVPWADTALANLDLNEASREQLAKMYLGLTSPSERDPEDRTTATLALWRALTQG